LIFYVFSIHFSFFTLPPPPLFTLFPYTTLFRSCRLGRAYHTTLRQPSLYPGPRPGLARQQICRMVSGDHSARRRAKPRSADCASDRKSTRLNSSHLGISYAVFCLKKKKN